MPRETIAALLAAALLVSSAVPAAGVLAGGGAVAQTTDGNGSIGVNVTVGQQLSTVVAATDGEVRSEVEETAFELRFEAGSEDERAEALADRAGELARRAIAIREDYRNATRAHEAGEISDSEYAERIATLNARAEDLAESVRRLRGRAAGLSALELRSAGFTSADLRAIDERLDAVTGTGAAALLRRFTGRTDGEIEIRTRGGLTIEVESEDGELSREIKRPRDGDLNITVSQTEALATARSQLGTPPAGEWALRRASVHEESGYYRFEFALTGANATGEAEVRVDGSSGEVFRLETEIERSDDDEDEGERDDEAEHERDELALLVDDGVPGPNQTVTLLALASGQPVANATVTLNGDRVGTTDADGRIDVKLPDGEAELRVESGDSEGELEFEFDEDERGDRELRRQFDVNAALADGNLSITVRYDGDPVENVTVAVEGREVGTTDENGQMTAEIGTVEADDLEVRLRRGALVAELEFRHRDGNLTVERTEFETRDRDDDERDDAGDEADDERETGSEDDEREDVELSIRVVEGDPAPGATVTVAVSADGNPIDGAAITVNDERVGRTSAGGRLEVTLPDTERVEIAAETDDSDAEIEFEFGEETEDEEDAERENGESDGEETETSGDETANEDDGRG